MRNLRDLRLGKLDLEKCEEIEIEMLEEENTDRDTRQSTCTQMWEHAEKEKFADPTNSEEKP